MTVMYMTLEKHEKIMYVGGKAVPIRIAIVLAGVQFPNALVSIESNTNNLIQHDKQVTVKTLAQIRKITTTDTVRVYSVVSRFNCL